MNFDFKKRYCQNRERKQKKLSTATAPPLQKREIESFEEERNFKLSRFVKDVNKFVAEKENATLLKVQSDNECNKALEKKENCRSSAGATLRKVESKAQVSKKVSKPVAKRGLFQNGVSTKFYTRGLRGKELNARLDENLYQIISLATNNKENDRKPVAQVPLVSLAGASSAVTPHWVPPHTSCNSEEKADSPKSSQHWQEKNTAVSATAVSATAVRNTSAAADRECGDEAARAQRLADLDDKLYPEFTRIVTLAACQAKSKLFKNQSYASEVKRKLLEIYRNEHGENTQGTAESNTQKSSVATSPIRSLLSEEQQSSPASSSSSSSLYIERKCPGINFAPEPTKSTLQFLKETLGPSPANSPQQPIFSPPLSNFYPPASTFVISPPDPNVYPSTSTNKASPPNPHAYPSTTRDVSPPLPHFFPTEPTYDVSPLNNQRRYCTRAAVRDRMSGLGSPGGFNSYLPNSVPDHSFSPPFNMDLMSRNKNTKRRPFNFMFPVEEGSSPELVYYPNPAFMR